MNIESEIKKVERILIDADMYGEYDTALLGIEKLLKDMYNKGIEDAVDHANIVFHGDPMYHAEVDVERILKLKI